MHKGVIHSPRWRPIPLELCKRHIPDAADIDVTSVGGRGCVLGVLDVPHAAAGLAPVHCRRWSAERGHKIKEGPDTAREGQRDGSSGRRGMVRIGPATATSLSAAGVFWSAVDPVPPRL